MTDDILGKPIHDEIINAMCEPVLYACLDNLEKNGWHVARNKTEDGYSIIFGKPEQASNTVIGAHAGEALEDLFRNLGQLGEIPQELREMMAKIKQQQRQIAEPIMAAVAEDVKKALGNS